MYLSKKCMVSNKFKNIVWVNKKCKKFVGKDFSMALTALQLSQLTAENVSNWKFRVESILESKGVKYVIEVEDEKILIIIKLTVPYDILIV